MRWKTPTPKDKLKCHRNGDRTTGKTFALLPTKLSDGTTVWLECYMQEYIWDIHPWKEAGWVDDPLGCHPLP